MKCEKKNQTIYMYMYRQGNISEICILVNHNHCCFSDELVIKLKGGCDI